MLFVYCVHLCCVSVLFMIFDILYLSFGLPAGTLFCSILIKHKTKSAQAVSKPNICSVQMLSVGQTVEAVGLIPRKCKECKHWMQCKCKSLCEKSQTHFLWGRFAFDEFLHSNISLKCQVIYCVSCVLCCGKIIKVTSIKQDTHILEVDEFLMLNAFVLLVGYTTAYSIWKFGLKCDALPVKIIF